MEAEKHTYISVRCRLHAQITHKGDQSCNWLRFGIVLKSIYTWDIGELLGRKVWVGLTFPSLKFGPVVMKDCFLSGSDQALRLLYSIGVVGVLGKKDR